MEVARRASLLPLSAALLAALFAAPAVAHPPRPNVITQPLADGCQRSPTPFITETETGIPSTPEWVFVYRDPKAKVVRGTAYETRIGPGDLPNDHVWYDMSSNIDPKPAYRYLLAGDELRKTGNFYGEGEDANRLHVEWESGYVPRYVRPTQGDAVKLWGSWIWDCGHWGQGFRADPDDPTNSAINDADYFLPGSGETQGSTNLRGEQTEFHPMKAMVIKRDHPNLPRRNATETDVFISTQGTEAYTDEQCARKNPAPPASTRPGTYGLGYTACVLQNDTHQTVNDQNYRFFVPAPPKPSPDSQLRYEVVNQEPRMKGPTERIHVTPTGLGVVIPFKGFGNRTEPLGYGKTFLVRWTHDPTPRPSHLRLTVNKIKVNNSLDYPNPGQPFQLAPPPGEYGMYLEVNGVWQYLNDWVPGLYRVNNGDSFAVNRSLDLYVPQGKGLRVYVMSRECDLPLIRPCPGPALEQAIDNDNPGTAENDFPTAGAAIGTHLVRSDVNNNYSVTYSVRALKR